MDTKNRLAVPAKLRNFLQKFEGLILSCGLEGCLNLMPGPTWKKLQDKLETLPLQNKVEQRAFKRMLYASASEVELDDEGRILVPQHLVSYAQIKREVAIIGLGEKIELWSKGVWEQYQKKQGGAFKRLAAQLEI